MLAQTTASLSSDRIFCSSPASRGVRSPVSYSLYVLLLILSLVLVSCTPSNPQDNDVRRQLTGNQGVLLVLQNSQNLDRLYLPYDGSEAPIGDGSTQRTLPVDPRFNQNNASGRVFIGELNLLLHNVGQSASAGGIFVSGYDPNLITVRSRLGQEPACDLKGANSGEDTHACLHTVIIDDGRYDVLVFCEQDDGTSFGFRVEENNGRQSQTVTFGGLPLDTFADKILSSVTGENIGWFSRNGFFGQGRFEVTNVNGKPGVRLLFGNPSGDPNRALRGFLLLNMLYGEISTCEPGKRVFPPRFQVGQVLLGVSDESPLGDAFNFDYDIIVDRSKWPAQLNDLEQTFQVTACYYYTTTLTPMVCIDPDPSDNRGDPCIAGPITYRNTQGAPIAVTRIDQRSVPGGTLFTVHLRHVGNGRFWEPGSMSQCGPYTTARADLRRQDVAYLLDARMAGDIQRLDCSPKNENGQVAVRFQNGVGQINCVYRQSQSAIMTRQAYASALTLEFGYLYQNIVSKRVLIQRI